MDTRSVPVETPVQSSGAASATRGTKHKQTKQEARQQFEPPAPRGRGGLRKSEAGSPASSIAKSSSGKDRFSGWDSGLHVSGARCRYGSAEFPWGLGL